RCLETDPGQRPPSVYAVLAALPGGDPLAAALAAGETPSPELVANARDAGGLKPAIALGLSAVVVAALAIVYLVHSGTMVMPGRSPTVLSVIAGQTMEELGYDELPGNTNAGYFLNARALDEGGPPFRYWRRWSSGVFEPVHLHAPEVFALDGRTFGEAEDAGESATVAIDPAGRLMKLLVTPGLAREHASSGSADWTPLFRRAGLDPAGATEIPPPALPPVHCEELVAWRIEGRGENEYPVVLMGAVGGRPNYFDYVGLDRAFVPVGQLQRFVTTTAAGPLPAVARAVLLLMLVLAIRNLRAGRGDRRNAVRCGLVVGGLYALMEALALTIGGLTGFKAFGEFSGVRMGHALIHGAEAWVIYMAVEPYVRRVWPRMLIGLVRLLGGRWRDPSVGREVLIGTAIGCALSALLALLVWIPAAGSGSGSDTAAQLPFGADLWSMVSPLHFGSLKGHRMAWTVIDALFLAGLLVAIRLVVRNGWATAMLGAAVLIVMVYRWGFLDYGDYPLWAKAIFALVSGTTVFLLYTRVGILASIVTVFVTQPYTVLAAGFGAWYSPYVVAELAIPLALGAYGLSASLAGRSILASVLAEP
ncbi:MAG: hypothetical protein PVF43_11140, partial [Candidatus Eiseniibacteriota bacterium]